MDYFLPKKKHEYENLRRKEATHKSTCSAIPLYKILEDKNESILQIDAWLPGIEGGGRVVSKQVQGHL